MFLLAFNPFITYSSFQPEMYFLKGREAWAKASSRATPSIASVLPDDASIISRLRPREDDIPEAIPIKRRKVGLTDKTLDSRKGHFNNRLDTLIGHWPGEAETINAPRCQLHTWATESRVRKKRAVMLCVCCNVYLCRKCWKVFHTTFDLVAMKKSIRQEMMIDQEGEEWDD